MTGLRIAKGLVLPIDYVTKVGAILAQRRKGKTYTSSVIAEELFVVEIPFVALDPTGAWWGLRASANGLASGLPVVIIGGQHGDLPLERNAGRFIADLVLDHPGYYVLDLSLLGSRSAEREFATDFAERLYRRKLEKDMDFPLHLFVDEADMFVPQEKETGDVRMLGAFQSIVRRGGLHGLGCTLISQRPALVNKSVLTQLDILILLRLVAGNDQDAVDKNYLSRAGSKERRAEVMDSLASLALGEAWIWEPGAEPPLYERVHIRERRTFNSSATPRPGERRVEPKRLADIDLAAIKEAMADAIEKAKADDPKELKAQIAALRKELATAKAAVATPVEVPVEVPVRVEVPVLDEALVVRLEQALEPTVVLMGQIQERLAWEVHTRENSVVFQRALKRDRTPPRTEPAPQSSKPQVSAPARRDTPTDIHPYALHLLTALARRHPVPMTTRQWSVAADRSTTSSAWDPAVRQLRTSGLIQQTVNGDWIVTEAGLDLAGVDPGTPPPSGGELIHWWCERIPGPAQTALRVLAAGPEPLTVDELADLAGWSRTSSGPGAAVTTLAKLGLVARRDGYIYLDEGLR